MLSCIARARAFALWSILCAAPLQAGAPPAARDAGRVSQAMLEELRGISGVPGLSAAVWQDGAVVWTGAAGMRDIAAGLPVTAETRFRIASVSKLFAATAAAKLAEHGRLDLDAPVTATLPWLDTDWPPITARQLAAHISGLPHYQEIDAQRGSTRYATGRDAVAIFSGRPLLALPGERYSYSSWGYTLLGAMVEEASGVAFGDYVRREVAPGLDIGPDATGTDPRASIAYVFADKKPVAAEPHDFSYTWAGGGMMASAPALVRFGGAMLENRVVPRASFERMLAPVPLNSGAPAGDDGFTVGLGWRSSADGEGRPIAYHNGSAIGARSALLLWRQQGIAASLLSNVSWTSEIDQTVQMLAAPFLPLSAGGTTNPCPTDARTYHGTFGETAVSGAATFALRGGVCRGELRMAPAMEKYFAGGPQTGNDRVVVFALTADGRIGRAGLVTPFGIYALQAETGSRTYTARFGPSRQFRFTLVR